LLRRKAGRKPSAGKGLEKAGKGEKNRRKRGRGRREPGKGIDGQARTAIWEF